MTTILPKGALRYGLQIVMLFIIAAVTAVLIIAHIEELIFEQDAEETIRQLNVGIWSLTMGFMFLAGALGLWAIRSTVETEGRRRIGTFVNAMDQLSDGLFVLDDSGAMLGSNPAGKELLEAGDGIMPATFLDAFPSLNRPAMELLLTSKHPRETQADCLRETGLRSLRFRSQPAAGVILILVSDVTEARAIEIRKKQVAQLQLVGRIAGGLADDFSDILCAISGHSSLLKRSDLDPDTMRQSLAVIDNETRKGALLSRMLLDLSRSGEPGNPTDNLADNVKEAASLLRVALSHGWTVRTTINGACPTISLTPAQVEQVLLNLGLLAADAQPRPGTVMITLSPPGHEHLLAVDRRFAAVILISTHAPAAPETQHDFNTMEEAIPISDESGVIMSVVRSIVEEADGKIEHLTAPDGLSLYRICLPHLDTGERSDSGSDLPQNELSVYVSRWHVLAADSSGAMDVFLKGLRRLGSDVDKKKDIGAALASLESEKNLDAVIIERRMLGTDVGGLLHAFVRLAPNVGILVLCDDPEKEEAALRSLAVFERLDAGSQNLVRAMVDAKTQARVRETGNHLST